MLGWRSHHPQYVNSAPLVVNRIVLSSVIYQVQISPGAVYDNVDIIVGANFESQAEETTTDGPSATTHSSRYPRREHRVPTHYSDYVSISYVKDETSP